MARRRHCAAEEVGGGAARLDDDAALVEEVAAYLQLQRVTPLHVPPRDTGRPQHKRFLLAYGGSEPEQQAIATTAWLSSGLDVEVRILHVRVGDVCRGGRLYLETPAEARAVTLDAVARLQSSGVVASGVVCNADRSDIVRVVLDEADQIAASAIVLGRRPRGMLTAALLGSVSRQILRRARCPVVLVNAPTFDGHGTATSRTGTCGVPGDGLRFAGGAFRSARCRPRGAA